MTDEQKAKKKARNTAWQKAHPGYSTGRSKVWREKNPEKAAVISSKTNARLRAEYDPGTARNKMLMYEYGITQDDYMKMLASQGGKCGNDGCGTFDPGTGLKYFDVDHDHITGAVRGLLCRLCNRGLGQLRDDLAIVRGIGDYLERTSKSNVIQIGQAS